MCTLMQRMGLTIVPEPLSHCRPSCLTVRTQLECSMRNEERSNFRDKFTYMCIASIYTLYFLE